MNLLLKIFDSYVIIAHSTAVTMNTKKYSKYQANKKTNTKAIKFTSFIAFEFIVINFNF